MKDKRFTFMQDIGQGTSNKVNIYNFLNYLVWKRH